MKFNLFIVASLTFRGISISYAQRQTTCQFGLTAGVNAGLIKSSIGYQEILWRYNAGIAIEQRFTPALALIYELAYSRQGGRVKDLQVLEFDYATLPIMVRFRPRGERAFIELGGQVGYLVHAHIFLPGLGNQNYPIDYTRKLDAGLTVGLGYRLRKHLVADGRYYYGMRSTRTDFESVDPQTGISTLYRAPLWYNRVYSINLTYLF